MNTRKFVLIILAFLTVCFVNKTVYAESYDDAQFSYKLAFGNGLYIVVNEKGEIKTSKDLKGWTDQKTIFDIDWPSEDILDGAKYVKSKSGEFIAIRDVIWAKDRFIGVGGANQAHLFSGSRIIISSKDGVNWKVCFYESGFNYFLNSVTYGENGFVAVGQGGIVLTSPDGEVWEKKSINTDKALISAAWGEGKYVTVNEDGDIFSSTNGSEWISENQKNKYYFSSINWCGKMFIGTGYDGSIFTSADGREWMKSLQVEGVSLNAAAWGNNQYIAAGDRGTVLTSTNGIDWVKRDIGTDSSLTHVIWDGKRFVVAGRGGYTAVLDYAAENDSKNTDGSINKPDGASQVDYNIPTSGNTGNITGKSAHALEIQTSDKNNIQKKVNGINSVYYGIVYGIPAVILIILALAGIKVRRSLGMGR